MAVPPQLSLQRLMLSHGTKRIGLSRYLRRQHTPSKQAQVPVLCCSFIAVLRPPPLRTELQQVPVAGADLEALLEVFTMSLYNEVNPLAVQHTKLAIKPNRSKSGTHSCSTCCPRACRTLLVRLRQSCRGCCGELASGDAVSLLGGTASSTRKLGRLPGEWQQLGERHAWMPKLLPDQMGRW